MAILQRVISRTAAAPVDGIPWCTGSEEDLDSRLVPIAGGKHERGDAFVVFLRVRRDDALLEQLLDRRHVARGTCRVQPLDCRDVERFILHCPRALFRCWPRGLPPSVRDIHRRVIDGRIQRHESHARRRFALRMACLEAPNLQLGNIEGAHRVHGWPVPLRIVNISRRSMTANHDERFPIAVLSDIGEPAPYVSDAVSTALAGPGFWEIKDPEDVAAAAGRPLPSVTAGAFLDIGAQLGSYSLAFARKGYRVLAIEPMLQNVLALRASLCLNPTFGSRVDVLHTAVVGARLQQQEQRAGLSCAVLSPFRASHNVGDGRMECVNRSGASQCARKHNGQVIRSNFTYFFHYRRFCQVLASPLRTLDDLLASPAARTAASGVSVAKIDTSGSECEVLHGGEDALFRRLRPVLLLVNVDAARSAACVRAMAATHGYSVHPFASAETKSTAAPARAPTLGKHVVLSRQ